MCDGTETYSSCPHDCKNGSSQTETRTIEEKTVDFIVESADAGVSGSIVDAGGNVLSDLSGHAELSPSSNVGGTGGPIERGIFFLKAPAGMYNLHVFLSSGSPYTAGDSQSVILVSGETLHMQVKVFENSSSITGTIKDQKGNAVSGVDLQVSATSKRGAWQEAHVDEKTGQYTLRVAADTWYLRVSGGESNVEVVVREGERVLKDMVVSRAESVLEGRVIDPDGKEVAHAFVGVSETSFADVGDTAVETEGFKDPLVAGTETDPQGMYRVAVPAGTYFVKTFVHPEGGLMNAKEQSISIGEREAKTLNFQLRKSDVAIEGKVLLNDKPVSDAFVWAWSKEGGYQESSSRSDGSFRLQVTRSSTWIVAAAHKIDGVFYKSSEVAREVGETNILQDIHLIKVRSLADPAVQTVDATKPTVVESAEGASVIAPANAISTTGFVSISVTPDTRIPSQGEVRVVGVAYDLEARDASGQMVSSFNSEVTVVIPYDEQELIALGVKEDNLVMSFWDETVGTWKTVRNFVVNKEQNTVNADVDHFTRFAIIAAADTSPPNAPTGVRTVALGAGQIRLAWQNPLLDFNHAKVYRSQESGTLGKIVAAQVLTNTLTDQDAVFDGVVYYYTVRAIDAAGNESTNTNQVSIRAIGMSVKETELALPPGQVGVNAFVRNVRLGSRGPDVKALQQFLNANGFLLSFQGAGSPGNETEFFGALSARAVTRFQEKYAAEILFPLGLEKGTGFFGPATRKKANELLFL